MRLSTMGVGREVEEQCRALLEEMAPGGYEFAPFAHETGFQEADFYIWDFRPEHFPQGIRPGMRARSLFWLNRVCLMVSNTRLAYRERASCLNQPDPLLCARLLSTFSDRKAPPSRASGCLCAGSSTKRVR